MAIQYIFNTDKSIGDLLKKQPIIDLFGEPNVFFIIMGRKLEDADYPKLLQALQINTHLEDYDCSNVHLQGHYYAKLFFANKFDKAPLYMKSFEELLTQTNLCHILTQASNYLKQDLDMMLIMGTFTGGIELYDYDTLYDFKEFASRIAGSTESKKLFNYAFFGASLVGDKLNVYDEITVKDAALKYFNSHYNPDKKIKEVNWYKSAISLEKKEALLKKYAGARLADECYIGKDIVKLIFADDNICACFNTKYLDVDIIEFVARVYSRVQQNKGQMHYLKGGIWTLTDLLRLYPVNSDKLIKSLKQYAAFYFDNVDSFPVKIEGYRRMQGSYKMNFTEESQLAYTSELNDFLINRIKQGNCEGINANTLISTSFEDTFCFGTDSKSYYFVYSI